MLSVRWSSGAGPVSESVGPDEVRRLLEDAEAPSGTWWLDAVQPGPDELAAVAALGGMAPGTLAALLASGRPGVRVGGPASTIVLPASRGEERALHADVIVVIAVPAGVVTCRRAVDAEALVTAVGSRLSATPSARAGDVLTIVVDEVVDGLWDDSDELDDRLAESERASLDDASAAHQALQALRRDILVLHRTVGPLRRVVADLIDARVPVLDAEHVAALRRSHDTVVELRGQIDTQLLLLNGLSQTQVLAASHRANEVMQATSSWGAILVVATLITGVYGMNFHVMPELRWELGYPFALALIVVTTVTLYGLFKWRGWL